MRHDVLIYSFLLHRKLLYNEPFLTACASYCQDLLKTNSAVFRDW